jgi:hypothetical protein
MVPESGDFLFRKLKAGAKYAFEIDFADFVHIRNPHEIQPSTSARSPYCEVMVGVDLMLYWELPCRSLICSPAGQFLIPTQNLC